MKKGKIFGKRMVVLAVLVLSLSAAVYLNWKYSSLDGSLDITGALSSSKYLGDAKYVNNQPTTGGQAKAETDFFKKSKTDRENARKENLANLKTIAEDVKADSQTKLQVSKQIADLAKAAENETSIETLVKAKGFADCAAVISDDQVNVIVKTSQKGLLASESMQIQDIVTAQTKISVKNIKIIEVK